MKLSALRRALAYSRQDYLNKISGHFSAGALHFFYIVLSRRLERSGPTVDYWEKELRTHIEGGLVSDLVHEIRGFKDRRKVYDKARAEAQNGMDRIGRVAVAKMKKVWKLVCEPPTEDDMKAFWEYVDNHVAEALDTA